VVALAMWVFHEKREDMGEQKMFNLKHELQDTRVGE